MLLNKFSLPNMLGDTKDCICIYAVKLLRGKYDTAHLTIQNSTCKQEKRKLSIFIHKIIIAPAKNAANPVLENLAAAAPLAPAGSAGSISSSWSSLGRGKHVY
jgi:hypothetical protein